MDASDETSCLHLIITYNLACTHALVHVYCGLSHTHTQSDRFGYAGKVILANDFDGEQKTF